MATYPPCSCCGSLDTLTVADCNLDGNLDIAVTGYYYDSVFYGTGGGKFSSAVRILGGPGKSVASGGFGRDQAPDLAITGGANRVAVLLNKKQQITIHISE